MSSRRREFACSVDDMRPYVGGDAELWVYLMEVASQARDAEIAALTSRKEKLQRGIGMFGLAGLRQFEIEELAQGWEQAVGVTGLIRAVLKSVPYARWTLEKGSLKENSVALGFGVEVVGGEKRSKLRYLKDPKQEVYRVEFEKTQGLKGLETQVWGIRLDRVEVWPLGQEVRLFGHKLGPEKKADRQVALVLKSDIEGEFNLGVYEGKKEVGQLRPNRSRRGLLRGLPRGRNDYEGGVVSSLDQESQMRGAVLTAFMEQGGVFDFRPDEGEAEG